MSGVEKHILQEGDGTNYPKPGDIVKMHYVGTLKDGGKKFDSSRDRDSPFQTQIGTGKVIKGWDEAVPSMSLGEKSVVTIPAASAYGDRGFPGLIPAGSSLVFEIELLGINNNNV